MRRIRTSTWIVTVIFLVAFVTYLFVKPAPAVTVRHSPARQEHSVSRTPVPGTPLPSTRRASPGSSPSPHITPSRSPAPSGSPTPSGSPSPSVSPSGPGSAQSAGTPAS